MAVRDFDDKIRDRRNEFLVVLTNALSTFAMVLPWFVVVARLRAERRQDPGEIASILSSDMLVDQLDSSTALVFVGRTHAFSVLVRNDPPDSID